jgi:hypothetical protein
MKVLFKRMFVLSPTVRFKKGEQVVPDSLFDKLPKSAIVLVGPAEKEEK